MSCDSRSTAAKPSFGTPTPWQHGGAREPAGPRLKGRHARPISVVTAIRNPRQAREFGRVATSEPEEYAMLTRTAIYEGTIKAGHEGEFFRRVRDELEPMWRRFPNVKAVRVQRTITADKDCPPIAMILEMDFEDMKAIEDCMASKIRPESHAATEKVMQLFDGRFCHLVAEATVLAPNA